MAIADEDYLDWPLREPERVVCRQRAMILSVRETCEHVLCGDCLLAHPSRRRLNSHNEAAVVVHQVIVVITQPSRCAALGGIGEVGIGRRYLLLLVDGLFHRVLLVHFLIHLFLMTYL